jgi:Zn-dependent protease
LATVILGIVLAATGAPAFFLQLQTAYSLPWWLLQLAFINLVLAAFNLIPIPPLDGSWVLAAVLPPWAVRSYDEFRRFGPILLLILFMTPLLNIVLSPILNLLAWVVIFKPLEILGSILS